MIRLLIERRIAEHKAHRARNHNRACLGYSKTLSRNFRHATSAGVQLDPVVFLYSWYSASSKPEVVSCSKRAGCGPSGPPSIICYSGVRELEGKPWGFIQLLLVFHHKNGRKVH
jgi:hypothetical protein